MHESGLQNSSVSGAFISSFDLGLKNNRKEFSVGGVLRIWAFQKIRKHTRRVLEGKRFRQSSDSLHGDMTRMNIFEISRFTANSGRTVRQFQYYRYVHSDIAV